MSSLPALVAWINSFAAEREFAEQTASSIADGNAINCVAAFLLSDTLFDPNGAHTAGVKKSSGDDGDSSASSSSWLLNKREIDLFLAALTTYAKENLSLSEQTETIGGNMVDVNAMCREQGDEQQVEKLLEILFTCCVLAGGITLQRVRSLPTETQTVLHSVVKRTFGPIGISKMTNKKGAAAAAAAAPSTSFSNSAAASGPSSATSARIAEEELRAAKQKIDDLTASHDTLSKKVASLEEQLQHAGDEQFRLKEKYQQAVAQSSATSTIETKELKNEATRLQRELGEATALLAQSREQLAGARAESSSAVTTAEKRQKRVEELEAELAKFKAESSSSGAELRSALEDVQALRLERAQLEKKAFDAVDRRSALEAKASAAHTKCAAAVEKLALVEAASERAKAALEEEQTKREAASKRAADAESQLDDTKGKLSVSEKRAADAERKLAAAAAQADTERELAQKKHDSAVAALQAQLEQRAARLAALEQEHADMAQQQQRGASDAQIALAAELERHKKKAARLEEEQATDRAAFQTELDEAAHKSRALVKKLESRCEELEKQVRERAETEGVESVRQVLVLQKKVDELKQALDEKRQTEAAQLTLLHSVQEEREAAIKQAETATKKLEAANARHQKEYSDLEQQLAEHKKTEIAEGIKLREKIQILTLQGEEAQKLLAEATQLTEKQRHQLTSEQQQQQQQQQQKPPPTASELDEMETQLNRALAENADMKIKLAEVREAAKTGQDDGASSVHVSALREENAQLNRQLVSVMEEMKKQNAVVVASLFECGQRNLQLQAQLVASRGGMLPGGRRVPSLLNQHQNGEEDFLPFFERHRRNFAGNALDAISLSSQPSS